MVRRPREAGGQGADRARMSPEGPATGRTPWCQHHRVDLQQRPQSVRALALLPLRDTGPRAEARPLRLPRQSPFRARPGGCSCWQGYTGASGLPASRPTAPRAQPGRHPSCHRPKALPLLPETGQREDRGWARTPHGQCPHRHLDPLGKACGSPSWQPAEWDPHPAGPPSRRCSVLPARLGPGSEELTARVCGGHRWTASSSGRGLKGPGRRCMGPPAPAATWATLTCSGGTGEGGWCPC